MDVSRDGSFLCLEGSLGWFSEPGLCGMNFILRPVINYGFFIGVEVLSIPWGHYELSWVSQDICSATRDINLGHELINFVISRRTSWMVSSTKFYLES